MRPSKKRKGRRGGKGKSVENLFLLCVTKFPFWEEGRKGGERGSCNKRGLKTNWTVVKRKGGEEGRGGGDVGEVVKRLEEPSPAEL